MKKYRDPLGSLINDNWEIELSLFCSSKFNTALFRLSEIYFWFFFLGVIFGTLLKEEDNLESYNMETQNLGRMLGRISTPTASQKLSIGSFESSRRDLFYLLFQNKRQNRWSLASRKSK